MAEENLLRIDVEKRTTRGRVCPRCGGKIIPSDQPGPTQSGNVKDVVMKKCRNERRLQVRPNTDESAFRVFVTMEPMLT